jgi:hypothetical protein
LKSIKSLPRKITIPKEGIMKASETNGLYRIGTWKRSERLMQIIAGAEPTPEEIQTLWTVYAEGEKEYGGTPTIVEFAMWLAGSGPYNEAAEVGW